MPLYYRGASIILVVYDITNQKSLMTGVREWIHELRVNGPEDAVLVLVGNKRDKDNALREVDRDAARRYANKVGALFFEASAKTGENVMNIFLTACSTLNKSKVLAYYSQNSNGSSTSNTPSTPASNSSHYSSSLNGHTNGKSFHFSPSKSVKINKVETIESNSCCKS